MKQKKHTEFTTMSNQWWSDHFGIIGIVHEQSVL